MKKLSARLIAALLIVSFVLPASLLLQPRTVSAQTGAATSCLAGYVTAGVSALFAVPQNILGVPKSQVGDTAQNVTTGGSANALSFNNCVLKPLGQAIVIALIRNIGASIVNWVNSGFEGKPLFVTDFGGTLLNAADQAIGGLIEGTELGFLCNDFSFQIRLELALKYSRPFQDRVTCTLSEIGDNVNNFVENNGGVGWNNWLELTTRPTNNIYGAYLVADSELARRALSAAGEQEKKITIAQGFLNFDTCDVWETPEEITQRIQSVSAPNQQFSVNSDGSIPFTGFGTNGVNLANSFDPASAGGSLNIFNQPGNVLGEVTNVIDTPSQQNLTIDRNVVQTSLAESVSQKPQCKKSSTKTPGKIISNKLSSVLGQGEIQAAVAQEIDQVIAATLNQIAQKAIQGASGLLGLSKKRSNSPPSYLDRYRAQYYGGSAPTAQTDIAARSELDEYMIADYRSAQALLSDTSDPNIRAITDTVNENVESASGQQRQQTLTIVGTLGGPASATVNAALLKPATQSSGTNPGGAVDGITQTSQYTRGSATYDDDASPWWEVNLGQDKKIQEVRVWKVGGKDGGETLGLFRVIAKTGAGSSWTSPAIDGAQSANPIVVPVNQTASAIRIEKTVSGRSCLEGYRGYYDGSVCYAPLELAEVEVIENVQASSTANAASSGSNSSSGSSGQSSSTNDSNSPVSVASQTGTARAGDAFGAEIGIASPANRSIGSVEVSFETSSGQPTAFSNAFSQATIGLKQGGVTRNFEPGSMNSMTFTGVSTGPSHDTRIILTGRLKALPTGASYTARVTAKGSDGATLSVGTIQFTVSTAQAAAGGGGATSLNTGSYGGQGLSGFLFDFSSQVLKPIPTPTSF